MTAPNELGLGRAYVTGELDLDGDIFAVLSLQDRLDGLRVSPAAGAGSTEDPGCEVAQAVAATARGGAVARRPAFEGARRGRDRAPLRRLERLLPDRAGTVDDLLLRGVDRPGPHARGGAGEQVRAGVEQARARARDAPARHRLWLGRDDPARGAAPRGPRGRRDAVAPAGRAGGQAGRRRGAHRPGRGPLPRLPGHRRRPVRRDQLDRHVRARRLDPARRVLQPVRVVARSGRAVPEPRDQRAAIRVRESGPV